MHFNQFVNYSLFIFWISPTSAIKTHMFILLSDLLNDQFNFVVREGERARESERERVGIYLLNNEIRPAQPHLNTNESTA